MTNKQQSFDRDEQAVIDRTVDGLNESTQHLSVATQVKINEARYKALSRSKATKASIGKPVWVMGSALAFCLVLVFTFHWIPSQQMLPNDNRQLNTVQLDAVDQFNDFIMFATTHEDEFAIIEDLEFAYWLSEELPHEEDALSHSGLDV